MHRMSAGTEECREEADSRKDSKNGNSKRARKAV